MSKECFEKMDGSNHNFMPVLYLSLDGNPERGFSDSEDKTQKNKDSKQQGNGSVIRQSENAEEEDYNSEASPKQGKLFDSKKRS